MLPLWILSLVVGNLPGVCSVLLGLRPFVGTAEKKRAHRLGAHEVVGFPLGAGDS